MLGSALFHLSQLTRDTVESKAYLEASSAQLLELLREEPVYQLDPYLFSRSAIEQLEEVRRKHTEELDQIIADRSDPDAPSGTPVIYIERSTRRRSRLLNFAPFALGQFQNGQEVKGTLLAVGQSIGLLANITGFLRNQYQLSTLPGGRYPRQPDNNPGPEINTAQTFRIIQYAGLAAFTLFYTYSVIDGLYFFEREQLLELKTLDGPPPELQPQNRLPPLQTWLEWRWTF